MNVVRMLNRIPLIFMYLLSERVENTLTLKLERAQLTAERLEHRLHMLQTNIQVGYILVQKFCSVIICKRMRTYTLNPFYNYRLQSKKAVKS